MYHCRPFFGSANFTLCLHLEHKKHKHILSYLTTTFEKCRHYVLGRIKLQNQLYIHYSPFFFFFLGIGDDSFNPKTGSDASATGELRLVKVEPRFQGAAGAEPTGPGERARGEEDGGGESDKGEEDGGRERKRGEAD